ncbi:hypothetical protein ERW28_RS26760, partial [Escherichia coli]
KNTCSTNWMHYQGMNVALKDAMLCWGEDEDKPEVDPFAALEDALSFAAQS